MLARTWPTDEKKGAEHFLGHRIGSRSLIKIMSGRQQPDDQANYIQSPASATNQRDYPHVTVDMYLSTCREVNRKLGYESALNVEAIFIDPSHDAIDLASIKWGRAGPDRTSWEKGEVRGGRSRIS